MQTTTQTTKPAYEGLTIEGGRSTATTLRLTRYQVLVTYKPVYTALADRRLVTIAAIDRCVYTIAAIEASDAAEMIWRQLPANVRERCSVTLTVRHPETNTLIKEFCRSPVLAS